MKEILLQSVQIGSLIVNNRFTMGAATDHMDDHPEVRVRRFTGLAEGGVGLIVSGATNLADREVWKKVAAAVQTRGGKFAIELVADWTPGILVSELPEEGRFFTPIASGLAFIEGHRAFTEK